MGENRTENMSQSSNKQQGQQDRDQKSTPKRPETGKYKLKRSRKDRNTDRIEQTEKRTDKDTLDQKIKQEKMIKITHYFLNSRIKKYIKKAERKHLAV